MHLLCLIEKEDLVGNYFSSRFGIFCPISERLSTPKASPRAQLTAPQGVPLCGAGGLADEDAVETHFPHSPTCLGHTAGACGSCTTSFGRISTIISVTL